MNRIPAGGVVPTESQMSRIETLTETGRMSHAEATNAVLGVMPKDVITGEPIQEAPAEAAAPLKNIDHNTRAGNLINVYRISLGLGPKIAKIVGLRDEQRSSLEREIRRDKNSREHFMENACAACPNQDSCDIKEKGFEGLMDVHPQLKPSMYEDVVYETESLQEMIIRISNNPGDHCDPTADGEAPTKPVNEAKVIDDEGDREAANLELRDTHLDKAAAALTESNKADHILKELNPGNTEGYEEKSANYFRKFADELCQGCRLCNEAADCPGAFNPKVWAEAKHYKKSPIKEWEQTIGDNGIQNESRDKWQKRRASDPAAPCFPKSTETDKPNPEPPTPLPDPGLPPKLPEAA